MRLFNTKIIDETLEGNLTPAKCSEWWSMLLGRAEALRFTCVVDGVSGSSPALFLYLYNGLAYPDNLVGSVVVNNQPLSAGTNVFSGAFSPQHQDYPPGRFMYANAVIAGANARAHVRVWVCGRGPQLLEATSAASGFAAQYSAAKMIEEEDRLPQQKRALLPGASQFYPPGLFLPSLKWER